MCKTKSIGYLLALLLIGFVAQGCGSGGGSGSDDTVQTASRVYSVSVIDIDINRTAGGQKVGVGPLPANGASIRVR